ncbi:MAG: L-threonylcarbamoyladenylate synthase [Elusimicrobia bacterium]|nr:L-threonylcarbamoyladenylate synthase [Elusimicrobiota bacterium]
MPDSLPLSPDGSLSPENASRAGAAGKGTKLVAFPTESSYAVGSTGLIKSATRRVLQVKERSTLKPLAVMVHSTEAAKAWVEWTPLAETLAAKFWPGPLLLLLKPSAQGRLLTFPEYPTVAIRVPSHPAARAMIAASGVPWVYTSANKSAQPPKLDAAAVLAELGPDLDLLIDGGSVPAGDATIVDATGDKPRVTKVGQIPAEAIMGAPAA